MATCYLFGSAFVSAAGVVHLHGVVVMLLVVQLELLLGRLVSASAVGCSSSNVTPGTGTGGLEAGGDAAGSGLAAAAWSWLRMPWRPRRVSAPRARTRAGGEGGGG